MGDDGIDGADLVDGIEFCLVINGALVGPVNVGNKGRVGLLEMEVLGVHAIGAVDGCGTSHTKDGVSTSLHHRIVGQCHPPPVLDRLEILGRAKRQSRAEIGRIVMVATNEQQPIVSFREPLSASLVNVLVIAWFLESKTAVASNDNHGIGHTVLYAAFIDELREVAMDVATHHDTFGIGEVILYVIIRVHSDSSSSSGTYENGRDITLIILLSVLLFPHLQYQRPHRLVERRIVILALCRRMLLIPGMHVIISRVSILFKDR